jgi:peptide/nickel transport system permease protein
VSDKRRAPDSGDRSAAIDLSRRKLVGRKLQQTAGAADEVVRASMFEARRAAAPYVTMARIALRQLARSRPARLGGVIIAGFALVAIFADVLANDLPLICRWHGVLYFFPNLTHPAALAGLDCGRMRFEAHALSNQGIGHQGVGRQGDWLLPPLVAFGPLRADIASALLPPLAPGHPLGTDVLGRDVFARTVHGARTALALGFGAAAVLVIIGVVLGALAGFAGGAIDTIVTRIVESFTAIPTLVLVLIVGALLPHPTTASLLWTIALTRWTDLARLVRAEVLLSLGTDYVMAARALGASPSRVLRRHVLPNAIGPAIVAAAFGIASVVLVEAAVDFLHAGPPDLTASWGESLGEARGHAGAWWLIAFPGSALLALLIALNLVGEAARDALDPKLRGVGEELTEAMRS